MIAVLLEVPAARAQPVPWLYQVDVPVEDRSARARRAASRVALLELLTRLTGLEEVPVDAVSGALSAPDLYYSQFGYLEVDRIGDDGIPQKELRLSVQFLQPSAQRLIREARLPIWRSERPTVVAWVVVETGGVREILSADSPSALAVAVRQRATERGLPLVLPLMDLEDQSAVDPASVWGRLSAVLDPASRRYDADVIPVGRVRAAAGGTWKWDWEFWIGGQPFALAGESADIAESGVAGVDALADELARRFAVPSREPEPIRLDVSGVQTPTDYAGLLDYLGGFEFVEDVALTDLNGDRLGVTLLTGARLEQLLTLFEFDGRLFQAALSPVSPANVQLMWKRADQ